MISEQQVRILMKSIREGNNYSLSAAKAGMDVKAARRYRIPVLCDLPSEILQFKCIISGLFPDNVQIHF